MQVNPESLLPFASTERQELVLKTLIKTQSVRQAAEELQCDRRGIYRMIQSIECRAASKGVAPHRDLTHQTAEGFNAKRISTAYKEDGSIALQWVIQEPEKRDIRAKIEATLEGLLDDLSGHKQATKPPKIVDADYCAMYLVGDHHFGMLASAETKLDDDNWDVKIATKVLSDAVDRLAQRVGNAKTGVLVNVGDFFHEDGKQMTTAGTKVDVDTRISRTFKLAGRLFQLLIDKMLQVHQEVVVINVRGNHDSDIACHLSSCLELLYDKEPRVNVLKNYSKFLHWEWENNLFVYHHGDRIKHEQILQAVITNLDEEWSKCKNRYCHLGHIHHHMSREVGSMQFSHWGSLTATDQWHSDSGYGAERSMTAIVYHKNYGEDSRVKIKVDALDA
tara:strand:- start:486 stop:1658 length:1173 start_codon:yes stop_codon:yes gene_type:complete